ncbi:MAG TPA: hypothetical protein PK079_22780 [Leptospiraceae bacterium]|nr:hypothetical protein [Leptospiraceae bacterium]HNC01692.1 hypothetical protein [Leptospiraceae bacterium]HNE11114.1 hypothetical protein [Leptospiraceae bacterium]HNE56009.1 hypothetical protein [Leptospiraceae bacterium]HNH58164.1 hypothetical protein [Leptospiraceae bacterium]
MNLYLFQLSSIKKREIKKQEIAKELKTLVSIHSLQLRREK